MAYQREKEKVDDCSKGEKKQHRWLQKEDDKVWVRSREERRCSNLGPTQSRMSPSILEHTKKKVVPGGSLLE